MNAVQSSKPWDLSCPDWIDRLKSGRSLVPDLPIDLVTGNRAVAIFNKLRLHDVPGTPTMEEAGGDWFRDIIRALFGSLDRNTRRRMIREVLTLVPKKNNKTTGGALLMLVALLLNERPKAPFILTAPVQDTADIAFEAAAGAIRLDPVLDRKMHIRDHLKTIIDRETKAELQIMTFDPDVLTGKKVAGALIDELHVIGKMSKAPSAIRQLRGGMMPFPEAFLFFITTQSEEQPTGIFHDEMQKARAIRDGRMQGNMLPVLYEFSEEMQKNPEFWRDPKNWHMVSPNLGRSIALQDLVDGFNDAQSKGEKELRGWASQHLNVEIGLALHSNSWPGALYWEATAEPALDLADLLSRCEVVTVGIDGGGLDDLLGVTVLGREKPRPNDSGDVERRRWLSWSHAFAHPIVLERRKAEAERFKQFEKQGDLTIVAQIGDDVQAVADIVEACEKSGLLERVGVDRAGIGAIVDALVGIGVKEDRIVGISQGWQMTNAIKTAERKLAEGTLIHADQPMMNWCVGNAKIEVRGNAVLMTKQQSGTAKIDPVLALLNAVTLMALNPKPQTKRYQLF